MNDPPASQLNCTSAPAGRISVPEAMWSDLANRVAVAASNVRDPETMRMAAQELDRLGDQIRARTGVLDVVLPILREMRNAE